MLDCDSDWATLYWYADVGCSGDAVNYTELEYFKCDLDYNCSNEYIVSMGLTGYENEDCSGDESLNAELPISYYAAVCIEEEDDDGSIYYFLIAFYNDTIYLGGFLSPNCTDTPFYWQEISDGYCDNSTEYSFEPYGETKLAGDCNYGYVFGSSFFFVSFVIDTVAAQLEKTANRNILAHPVLFSCCFFNTFSHY